MENGIELVIKGWVGKVLQGEKDGVVYSISGIRN